MYQTHHHYLQLGVVGEVLVLYFSCMPMCLKHLVMVSGSMASHATVTLWAHLVLILAEFNICLAYFFFNVAITPWSIACSHDVVF